MKYNKHYPINYRLYGYDDVDFVAQEVCFTKRAMTMYGYFEDEPETKVAAITNADQHGFCLDEFETPEDAADMFFVHDAETKYIEY